MVLEMRAVLTQGRLLRRGIVTAPKLDSLDPDVGGLGHGDRGAVRNVPPVGDGYGRLGKIGDSRLPGLTGLDVTSPLACAGVDGGVIGHEDLLGLALGRLPSAFMHAHSALRLSADKMPTWTMNTAETKGAQAAS